jgi:hypothetical protein
LTLRFVEHVSIDIFSAVTAGNKEVKRGSSATISCTVSDLQTGSAVSVSWTEGVNQQDGTVEGSLLDGVQNSTLTVVDPQSDMVYTCIIVISASYSDSQSFSTAVALNIFGKWV